MKRFMIGIGLNENWKRYPGEMRMTTEELLESLDPPADLGDLTSKAVNTVRGEDEAPEVGEHVKGENEAPEVGEHVKRENKAPEVGEHVRKDLERRHDSPERKLLEMIRTIIILTLMNQRKSRN